jgi:hypothetical protein
VGPRLAWGEAGVGGSGVADPGEEGGASRWQQGCPGGGRLQQG